MATTLAGRHEAVGRGMVDHRSNAFKPSVKFMALRCLPLGKPKPLSASLLP